MKIVFLAIRGESTTFMYNAIKEDFKVSTIIIENRISSKILIKRRLKKLGWLTVFNQLLFQLTVPKYLKFTSKKNISKIKKLGNLKNIPLPKKDIVEVPSANSKECIAIIKQEKPDIIIVNGTRILGEKLLGCTNGIFINTHTGITPQYRGIHGAYWALVNKDKENCGVTIHEVDKGIDTGPIFRQAKIKVNKTDNFVTYPYHQYGIAIKMMKEVLKQYQNGELKSFRKENSESKLYYHPTLLDYLKNRFFSSVK